MQQECNHDNVGDVPPSSGTTASQYVSSLAIEELVIDAAADLEVPSSRIVTAHVAPREESLTHSARLCSLKWGYKRIALLCVSAIAALALILTLSLGLREQNRVRDAGSDVFAPQVSVDSYFDMLYEYLVTQHGINGLQNPSTASYEALEWMAFQDGQVYQLLPVPTNPQELQQHKDIATRIDQRYALLVFSFATGGPDFWDETWLQPGLHECDAVPIQCASLTVKTSEMEASVRVVTRMNVREQALFGTLPKELFLLSNLQRFEAGVNRLQGSLPATWFSSPGLPNLRLLDVSFNSLTGILPSMWQLGVPELVEANLATNRFDGSLPETLPPKLERFRGLRNQWTGTIPFEEWALNQLELYNQSAVTSFSSSPLEVLDVGYCPLLGGSVPEGLAAVFPNLTILGLYDTALEGSLPNDMNGLTKLFDFSIANTRVTGTLPRSLLWEIPSLAFLVFSFTDIGGTIPLPNFSISSTEDNITLIDTPSSGLPTLNDLPTSYAMSQIIATDTQLSGTLPSELGLFANLEALLLAHADLTGTIPIEFEGLSNMQRFWIHGNLMEGSVPQEVCSAFQYMRDFRRGCDLECSCCPNGCY